MPGDRPGGRSALADAPDDPLDWRPMRPAITRRPVTIRDPLVEPLWSGTRVIAHVSDAEGGGRLVRLMVDAGDDLAPLHADLAGELGPAVQAGTAIVDGLVTAQALLDGEGTAVVTEPLMSQSRILLSGDVGVDVRRRDDATEPDTDEIGFVCLDLLAVDGEPLLDVPLLERKRLLEAVVAPTPRILVSVHTRPPVDTWLATWKSLGLRGAMLKAANSRYQPGTWTVEWRAVERLAGRR